MLTPSQKNQIVIMRESGYSIASICERVGAGATAVKATLKTHKIGKGAATAALVSEARNKLLSDHTFSDSLRTTIAGLLHDDLAIVRRIRESIVLTLDQLDADETMTPVMKGRVLAALSTSLVVTQNICRKTLQISKHEAAIDMEQLPELRIHYMTEQEQAAISDAVNSDDFDLCEIGADDDDVIEEGM